MVYKYLKIQLKLWSLVLYTTQGSQAKFSVEITATHPWSCKATPSPLIPPPPNYHRKMKMTLFLWFHADICGTLPSLPLVFLMYMDSTAFRVCPSFCCRTHTLSPAAVHTCLCIDDTITGWSKSKCLYNFQHRLTEHHNHTHNWEVIWEYSSSVGNTMKLKLLKIKFHC